MASPSPDHNRPRSPGDLLRELGITPSKALGQHFLHDRKIVQRIVRESGIGADDVVLEIGPGLGILTRELARVVHRVVAVERDQKLGDALVLQDINNLKVVLKDALEIDFTTLMQGCDYHVVANLPYSVGTAIIQRLQESQHPPKTLTVMLQREVAERIVATPPDMNLLAVGVQYHGVPRLLFRVGKGAFVPPPNVQSAVIRIETRGNLPVTGGQRDVLFRIIQAGFAQPRKQLVNNLTNALGLDRKHVLKVLAASGIDPTIRPERLSVQDWVTIYSHLTPASTQTS